MKYNTIPLTLTPVPIRCYSSLDLAIQGLTQAFILRIKMISSNVCLVFLESVIYLLVVVISPDNHHFRESRLTSAILSQLVGRESTHQLVVSDDA